MQNLDIEALYTNIINNIFQYNIEIEMDDETEFFPILKVLINSMIEKIDNKIERERLNNRLLENSKDKYTEIWLEQAETDLGNGFNEEEEIIEAKKQFKKIFENI